jgi:hypothetical protein
MTKPLFLVVITLISFSLQAQTAFKSLNYLNSISGARTVAGQQARQYWEPMHTVTGKYPGLWGEDFSFSPFGGTTSMAAWRSMITNEAKQRWASGALISMMFHACPPTQAEPCNWDGGVVSHLSDAQWNELITNGTTLNNNWKARLDVIATYLQDLENNGVEVLFRPFHEMNQGVFWWAGRTGANGTRKLFQITRDYLVNTKGLSNLIWVWDLQDFSSLSSDLTNYDPGSNYWDILALDVYWSDGTGFTSAKYNALLSKAGSKPIAIGECGTLPTASELASQQRYTFFMGWAELTQQQNSASAISAVYNASNVATLDEMPGWAGGTCSGTASNLPATLQGESYCQMSGVQTETTTDTGGGLNVGYIDANDWMAYRINVPATGTYRVQYRVASQSGGGNIRLEPLGGGTAFGSIAVPSTGGWQTWTTISHNVTLNAGIQNIALVAASAGFNINWLNISSVMSAANLAYNRPVTTTSNENTTNTGAKAVDANGTTRWSSAYSNNQNFVVDLGANYNVSRVRIAWESAYAKDYQIQFSTDNVNWTTVREFWGKSSAATDDQTGLTGVARYVKIYCINRATTYGFSFYEFEVYGTSASRIAAAENEELAFEEVTAFPNPTHDKLKVKFSSYWQQGKVSMVNALGKKLISDIIDSDEKTFDLSQQPSGLYLIQIRNGHNRKVIKIEKQ